MFTITLNQLAIALLGAGAYIYHISQRSGWRAVSSFGGQRIERSSHDPYCAIAQVAQVLIDYEAVQAAEDWISTPAARAAYRAAWAASEGQPHRERVAAAEAAAAATESAGWPSTIRTEQDNARTMQRLASITGRASAATAATAVSDEDIYQATRGLDGFDDEADPYTDIQDYLGGYDDDDESDPYEEMVGDYYSQAD